MELFNLSQDDLKEYYQFISHINEEILEQTNEKSLKYDYNFTKEEASKQYQRYHWNSSNQVETRENKNLNLDNKNSKLKKQDNAPLIS
ncbi:unnamed protein product [Blepharisma stoltei]|uniref:Uncharacterized protein n=1 Tax=Blepharisma stoltei TaxID=1481888 RepID=A0AAU9JDC4_9CILI|nr:unnamed protein product [Blepharisma stoltei]